MSIAVEGVSNAGNGGRRIGATGRVSGKVWGKNEVASREGSGTRCARLLIVPGNEVRQGFYGNRQHSDDYDPCEDDKKEPYFYALVWWHYAAHSLVRMLQH